MPTVIDTSGHATATAYSNQRKVDRTSNGVLWTLYTVPSDNTFARLHYSTDNGATWTLSTSWLVNGSNSAVANYVPNASFFIDVDDYAHVVFKDNGNGYIYYRRGTPNAGRTAWTWSAAVLVFNNVYRDYPDVVAHREGTGWAVHIVHSVAVSGTNHAIYNQATVAADGTISMGSQLLLSPDYKVTVHTWPSIDFNHTGDGKTVAGGTPHLYVGWSAGTTGAGKGIRFKKATYSAGSWTWGTEREIDSTRFSSSLARAVQCMFDGTRVYIAAPTVQDSSGSADVLIYERDAADTASTTHLLIDNVGNADILFYGSATYDGNGNVYLFGRHHDETAGTYDLVYRKWTRSTTTLEAEVVIDAGVGDPYVSAKRGFSDGRIEFVYTDGTASPYSVTFDAISLNAPPNAPTGLSPAANTTINRDATNRFSWTFSDPDSGDSQSAYDLRYRLAGGTTWTDVSGTTPNAYHDFAAGTFAAGDYEWQVRTYDAAGVVGPYSASAFFTAASPPATPSITDPVNGQTIATETYTVVWSAPSQDAYHVRTVADNAGTPDATTVYTDTGTVESSSARSRTVSFAVNNRTEHVQVRIRDNGLWSSWASVSVDVSYTTPPSPTVTATGEDASGRVAVGWTNPAPAAGEPTVTSMRVYRTVDGVEILLAKDVAPGSSPYLDRTLGAQESATYRVVAVGDNGTSASSAASAAVVLDLAGVWLAPAADLASGRQYRANGDGGSQRRTVEQAARRYAGRALPVVEYGEGREVEISTNLALTDHDAWEFLVGLEGRIVLYRDHRGRRVFGTVHLAEDATFYGRDVDLSVSAVDYTEAVAL